LANNFTVYRNAFNDKDLTLVKATEETPKTDSGSTRNNLADLTWNDQCGSQLSPDSDGGSIMSCPFFSAVFTSNQKARKYQDDIFIAGVFLALIGSLVIAALNTMANWFDPILDRVPLPSFQSRSRQGKPAEPIADSTTSEGTPPDQSITS
jgi:hypothetical protein